MLISGHIVSALPFAMLGQWEIALGCILPDISWLANEVKYRRGNLRPWSVWAKSLKEGDVRWYRWAHSLLLWGIVALISPEVALGASIHILLDLPTHNGLLTQKPFYPINWRWPWPKKE